MDKHMVLLPIRLDLFDAGAAAGTGAAAAGTASGGEGADGGAKADTKGPGSSRQAKKAGELANVRYGKQPDDQGPAKQASPDAGGDKGDGKAAPAAEKTAEQLRAEWEEMVKGPYKELFTADTQKVIDRRFKETKTLQQQTEQVQPIVDSLMVKYGIKDGDFAALQTAMDRDDSLWEAEADAKGMTIDQLRAYKQLERENLIKTREVEALKAAEQAREADRAAQEQVKEWHAQAERLKQQYPSFDLLTEMQSQGFVGLLQKGIPVEHAFKVIHHDELMTGAIQAAAQKTEKQVLDGVRSKSARPLENGAGSQSSAFVIKNDVSKLTAKDRAEIMRRARQGERIEF